MGGKSKEVTVSYWYKLIAHFGWCKGPIDALLEIRGGDRVAWSGRQATSGIININKPNLYGGEKAEGGIVGQFEVMMGEPDQMPNSYLAQWFGALQSGYRGRATGLIRGAKIGAGNPYPKPWYFKLERIFKGWDDDVVWYPEKAKIVLIAGSADAVAVNFDYAGGADFPSVTEVDVGSAPGMIHLDYATGPNPDKFEVWVDGVLVASTGYHGKGSSVNPATSNTYQVDLNDFLTGLGLPTEAIIDTPGSDADANLQWANNRETLSFTKTSTNPTVVIKVYSPLSGTIWKAGVRREAVAGVPGLYGFNPVHMLYDSLTSRRENGGMEQPVGLINDASFRAAADKVYSEGMGACTAWKEGESAEQFQQRILNLIGGAMSQSFQDGLYYVDLARGDYDILTLPTLTDDDIIDWNDAPVVPPESINQIQVKWFDPQTREERITAPVQALGAIEDAGGVFADVREYYEIPVESLALKIADRDLVAVASPIVQFDITTTRKAFDLRPGMYLRLMCPKRGYPDTVVLMAAIDYGSFNDGEEIQITALEDVFRLSDSYVQAQPSLDPDSGAATPVNITKARLMEAPYVELSAVLPETDLAALAVDAGYVLSGAARPTGGVNYQLATKADGESYEVYNTGDYCPYAEIVEAAPRADAAPPTDFTYTNDSDMVLVQVGTWAVWGIEIVRVDAIDTTLKTITLGRGCADTVPVEHAAGSAVYFLGDWNATDGREYSDGELVFAKLMNRTSQAQIDIDDAVEVSTAMGGRQARPYPPGNVKIDGVPYKSTAADTFVITWAHRNRDVQANQLIDTTAGDVTPPPNTRYALRVLDAADALLVEKLDIGPTTASVALNYTGDITVQLYAIDDNAVSYQTHVIPISYTGTAASNEITATTYTRDEDDGTVILDGGDLDEPPPPGGGGGGTGPHLPSTELEPE